MGKFLFRYRSYTPLILGVPVLLPFSQPPTRSSVVGALVLMVLAEIVRLWAVKYATGGTRTRSDQTHPLCTTGPYAIIRNPLYVANVVLYVTSAGLFSQSWVWVVSAMIIFAVQYGLVTRYEGQHCFGQFGETYQSYVTQVPAWIPQWPQRWQWDQVTRPAAESWVMAFRNERRGLTAIGMVWGVFLLKVWLSL